MFMRFRQEHPSELPENVFMVHAEYVSSGLIGAYTDWLKDENSLSLSELTEIIVWSVENGWSLIRGETSK